MAGLMIVKNNAQLLAEEEARRQAESMAKREAFETNLASHVRSVWEAARQAKSVVQQRCLRALRQRSGEYEPDKLAAIRAEGGPLVYMMLTDEKCAAAEAWLEDILLTPGEKPWAVRPTPIPDLSVEKQAEIVQRLEREVLSVMQAGQAVTREEIQARAVELKREFEQAMIREADRMAEGMERRIEDMFQEGGFYTALREAIQDIVTYPAGFVKGPVLRRRKSLAWDRSGGSVSPVVVDVLRPEWYCVSPFDMYPAASARGVHDGDLVELVRMTPGELYDLIGVPGYNETAIREVLDSDGAGIREWLWSGESERAALEDRPQEYNDPKRKITALNYWGAVRGRLLLDWGIEPSEIDDPEAQYQCEVWQIGPWSIKARVNKHPLQKRPYCKASFRNKPGSFWGFGVPEIMSDSQDLCNAAVRNLAVNMGISSGPQVAADMDQMDATVNVKAVVPWKIWTYYGNKSIRGGLPLNFFQPSSNVDELLKVYDKFSLEADAKTGIPKYIYGSGQTSGVLNTASGFSMMVNNATKGIKRVVSNIDKGMTEPAVSETWLYVMLYDDDMTIKGDVNIVALGSSAMAVKETQQLRRNEFLQSTSNPVDLQIMGVEGRAELLRESLKSLDFAQDKILPSREEMERRQQQQAAAQMPQGQPGAQQAPPGQGAPMLPDGNAAGGGQANLMRVQA